MYNNTKIDPNCFHLISDLNNWQEKTVNRDNISNDEISKILKGTK